MNPINHQPSAFLYTRVSTEEQAVNGGSLKTQQDILLQYCHLHNIKVERVFVEDHSAKTFNRPEWKKLMLEIGKSGIRPSFVLFTRWDRFSGNTGDAYYEIKNLKRLGVEPQAIEQPLDLSIPENKMMFAFYLAIPEAENDRRGLNTKMGMQRAKQRGKWLGRVPIGYRSHYLPDGSKLIMPKESEASVIGYAFYQLANLRCNITDAYLMTIKEGITCSRSNFWKILQNPIYAGNIVIKDENNSSSYLIPGLHRAIVSTPTFNRVQELFFKRRKKTEDGKTTVLHSNFFLKNYIGCPKCGKLLTASFSTGRTKRYAYYHCHHKCSYRIRCEHVHQRFFDKLKGLKPHPEHFEAFKELIQFNYSKENRKINLKKMRSVQSIELFTERIYKAKNLLLDGHIEYQQYAEIKSDLEAKIRLMGYTIEASSNKQVELAAKVEKSARLLRELDRFIYALDENNKVAFVSLILNKNVNWETENMDHIFKTPFQIVFGLNTDEVNSETRTSAHVTTLIKGMADMELLISG